MPFTIGGDWIPNEQPKKNLGPVKVRKERRKNKLVTIVSNLSKTDDEIKDLAKKLRNKLGTGGTVKEGNIEIQGDLIEKVKRALQDIDPSIKVSP
ncbi:MAG: translation initiation factor [Simkaniaceae bacterium]|nr:translation initiation factor [Simkaniaceae bacterium]